MRVLDAIVTQARAEAPLECCGLLIGHGTIVTAAHPAHNVLASPTRYRVDPKDHFAAIREARTRALAVVGAYHSHPSPPRSPRLPMFATHRAKGFST